MPVGVNYLCLLGLLLAIAFEGSWRERWQRLSEKKTALALGLFMGWTALVLIFQGTWYDRTPSNLWHGFRICLTLGLAASLTLPEATRALLGFILSTVCALALAFAARTGVIEVHPFWEHLTVVGTNKTIGASILLAVAFVVVFARATYSQGKDRWVLLLATVPIVWAVYDIMSKRTAILSILMAALLVLMHVSKKQKKTWIISAAFLASVCYLVWIASPALQAQFAQGIHEMLEGIRGQVKVESWNVRVQMIKHTIEMISDHPWLGWGIGAWNYQWAIRAPMEIASFNMPHNDLLWMSAQGGVIAGLLWLFLMTSELGNLWKASSWNGAAASATVLVCTFSSLVNNGTRDATIGLPMLWIMGVLISLTPKGQRVQQK